MKALPASVDWREAVPSVLTAVKDQGGCGSVRHWPSVSLLMFRL
jgi:hypothetical protein